MVIAFLLCALAALTLFWFLKGKKPKDGEAQHIYSYESTVTTADDASDDSKSDIGSPAESSDGAASDASSNFEPDDTSSDLTSTDITDTDGVNSTDITDTNGVNSTVSPPNTAGNDTVESTEETINENYSYVRLSEYPYSTELFETYGYSSAFLSDKIAIVSMQGADDGVYNIPEKINGYTVFAIINSHSTEAAKSVKCIIIPKTVSLISDNTFKSIYYPNLTDVYYCGTALNMLENIFSAPIDLQPRENPVNLHCLPDCVNTATYELFSAQTPRGSVYVEWDGILPN